MASCMKHKAAKITEAVGKKQLVKVRDLVQGGMPQNKAEAIRDKRKAANQTQPDLDFPDDPDELRFWYVVEVSTADINRTEESMEIEGRADLDHEQLEDIGGGDGILAAGLRVAAPGVNDKDALSFAEDTLALLSNEGTGGKVKLTRAKPKAENTGGGEEVVVPATARELAQSACDQVMKEMKDAEGYSVIINAHGLCKETANSMQVHAEFLRLQYQQLATLVARDAPVEEYLNPLTAVADRQKWFDETAPLAKKLVLHVRSLKGAPPKKKKKTGVAE